MDTRTGEIMTWIEAQERIKKKPDLAKIIKEIPSEYVEQLEGMNRKERREWYRKNKDKFKTIPTTQRGESNG